MVSQINFKTIKKELPIFSTNIGNFQYELDLAEKAIYEEQRKNPRRMESNVFAKYVSDYSSHLLNPNFTPLINLVLNFTNEVSRKYFNFDGKYVCYNCWGMLYDDDDFAVNHSHFPSTFAAVVYIEVEENSSPIVFENDLTVFPTSGSLILFPGMLHHFVPRTKGKRKVVAMNIDVDVRS